MKSVIFVHFFSVKRRENFASGKTKSSNTNLKQTCVHISKEKMFNNISEKIKEKEEKYLD